MGTGSLTAIGFNGTSAIAGCTQSEPVPTDAVNQLPNTEVLMKGGTAKKIWNF